MGRRQYLQRLALGRSAFEDLPEQVEDEAADNDGDTEQATVANDSNHYVQQYDRKGRPTNPATEAFNARLRHAQNSVLALVGVVERKESQDLAAQHALSAKRAHREHLLQQENDRGDEIETLANVAAFLLTWLPETLLRRLEVGLHDDMLFSVTVAGELTAVLGCGWRGLGGALWPGMGSMLSYRLAWYAIAGGVEEIVSWVQGRALASDMRRQTTRRVVNGLAFLCDLLTICIDRLLLPLELKGLTRQLGLSLPSRSQTLPFGVRYRKYLHTLSHMPRSLIFPLLIHNLLNRSPSPFFSLTASSPPGASPPINAGPPDPPPVAILAPFMALQNGITDIRQRFLAWTSWEMTQLHPPGPTHGWETDLLVSQDYRLHPHVSTHRSTSLARLPAQWLCERLDGFLMKILLLPLEGLVMQRVASWWLGQGRGGSNVGLSVDMGSGGWRRASQVGLGLLANLAVEGLVFAGVWAAVRWQGVNYFGWGEVDRDDPDDDGKHKNFVRSENEQLNND